MIGSNESSGHRRLTWQRCFTVLFLDAGMASPIAHKLRLFSDRHALHPWPSPVPPACSAPAWSMSGISSLCCASRAARPPGTITVTTLQSAAGAAIPTLPAGGEVRVALTCVPLN